jgi:hypothetical protein
MKNALGYTKLAPRSPVPTDIEISQEIVRDMGILSMSELAQQLSSEGTGIASG